MGLAFFIPVSMAFGLFCLLPALVPSMARLHASRMIVGLLLLLPLVFALYFHADISASQAALLGIASFAGGCIVAPLLDRARSLGAVLAATLGGLAALLASMQWFQTSLPLSLFTTSLTIAVLVGFAGSVLLPMSPLRHTISGATRFVPSAQHRLLAGWVLLAIAILLLAQQLDTTLAWLPLLVSAASAGFITVMTRAHDDAPQKTGEALVAGLLVALIAKLSPEVALIAGVLAALCVNRSEAATQALRLDDPLHMAGALLLPLILGTLLPGALDMTQLAAACTQLGHALAAAALISVILWPVVMIFTGLALPTRLAREGMRRP